MKDGYLDDAAVQRLSRGRRRRLRSVEIVTSIATTCAATTDRVAAALRRADVTGRAARSMTCATRARDHGAAAKPAAPEVEPSPHCLDGTAASSGRTARPPSRTTGSGDCPACRRAPREVSATPASSASRRSPTISGSTPPRRARATSFAPASSSRRGSPPRSARGPPARYLDFETMFPTVPIYPGMRPYEQVPFQWSLHQVDAGRRRAHRELLTDGRTDPRPAFARTLLAAIRADASPSSSGPFESGRLDGARRRASRARRADARVRARLGDLQPVRAHVCHPEFGGSFSLKQVAPALVPGFAYDDLDGVGEGGEAATALCGWRWRRWRRRRRKRRAAARSSSIAGATP